MSQLFNHDKLTIANQLKMGQNQSGVIASEQLPLQQKAAAGWKTQQTVFELC